MKPKRIILIRHGESEGNVCRNVYGEKPDYALLLTPTGEAQATHTGQQLRELLGDESVQFYVSPLWRTRMTFERIAAAFLPDRLSWVEEQRLREQDWGHIRTLEECAHTVLHRDTFGTFYYRIPDGESAADVYDRVSDFFGTLHRDFAKPDFPENAVLVTHGITLRMFLMRWFHWTVEEFEATANPANCQVVVLEKQPDHKYRLTEPLARQRVFHSYQRPLDSTFFATASH